MRGVLLAQVRGITRLTQAEVARHIPRLNDPTRSISDALLSQLESEAIPLPEGFAEVYLAALIAAHEAKGASDGE